MSPLLCCLFGSSEPSCTAILILGQNCLLSLAVAYARLRAVYIVISRSRPSHAFVTSDLLIRIRPIAIEQILYFLKHGFDIPKRAVDTGKTDICNLIHSAQPLHHHLSNDTTLYFFSAETIELLFNL